MMEWIRQLGWWHDDIPNWMESHNPFMFQTTNQWLFHASPSTWLVWNPNSTLKKSGGLLPIPWKILFNIFRTGSLSTCCRWLNSQLASQISCFHRSAKWLHRRVECSQMCSIVNHDQLPAFTFRDLYQAEKTSKHYPLVMTKSLRSGKWCFTSWISPLIAWWIVPWFCKRENQGKHYIACGYKIRDEASLQFRSDSLRSAG